MAKKSGFKRSDLPALQKAMAATKDRRTYQRMEGVALVAEGRSASWVATHLQKSRQIVYRWLDVFLRTHDPYSLQDAPKSGRPLAAQAITEKRIFQALHQSPPALGYRAGGWTVGLPTQYLAKRYHCAIAPPTLRRRMKQLGLRYKRPRYVYEEKDPNRAQKKGRSPER
jgi:transposase